MNVQLVCDTDIIGVFRGTRTAWFRSRYIVSHIILGLIETVGFSGNLRFEIWVEIQGRGVVSLVYLKVAVDYLEWNVNRNEKCFFL